MVVPASISTAGKVSAPGQAPTRAITNDYDAFGLAFGVGGETTAIVNDPPLAWAGVVNGAVNLRGPVHGAFVLPGTGGVEAQTSRLSVEGGFAAVGTLRLEAFDCAGRLIAFTANDDGLGPNGRTLMTLTAPGMHSFRVTTEGSSTFAVPSIDFGDPVPCADADGDGVADRLDNCRTAANADQRDTDGDGAGDACDPNDDADGDGVADAADNCRAVANADQRDADGDGAGDACDGDADGDGVADTADNCPTVANASQADAEDADGIGDACDDSDGSTPPVAERSLGARVTRGTVLVSASGADGTFVPLEGAETIPIGAVIDATNGAVKLRVAAVRKRSRARAAQASGAVQEATVFAGIFQIRQIRVDRARRRAQRLMTQLRLRGAPIAAQCATVSPRGPSPVVRRLWADAHGRFQTVGRRSKARVRGTRWLTEERCDGTLTRVEQGVVAVRDVAEKDVIVLRAGRSYLARGKLGRHKGRRRPIGIPARSAQVAPPPNDNYLESTPLHDQQGRLPRTTKKDQLETGAATVQSDLFTPPDAGGGVEDTECETTRYGKTVWYDIHADTWGVAEFQASGFPTVVAAYEYDPITAQIIRKVGCASERGTTTDAVFPVERGHWYTVQIGGIDAGQGPASGLLQMTFDFFADRDRDGIFDALDKCDDQQGIKRFSGCLPRLPATNELTYTPTATGVRLGKLAVKRLPRGTRVVARCVRGCSLRQSATVRGGGALRLSRFIGPVLENGSRVEIRRTHPRTKGGTYTFGAIGNLLRLDVDDSKVIVTVLCLMPGSKKPRRSCR
jgi:hypothetical protein